jgi:hypothetical protein
MDTLAEMGRLLLYGVGLVLGIGAVSHALGWVMTRRRTTGWVWRFWSAAGAGLLAAGVAIIAYGWLGLGLHSTWGGVVVGVGLLLASAGLWMLVPV